MAEDVTTHLRTVVGYLMNDQTTKKLARFQSTLIRFATYGALFGSLLGVALAVLLRKALGPTPYYWAKTAAIAVIVATLGGFVGILVEAFVRSRHR